MATDAPPDPTRRDFMRSVGALGAAVRLSAHVGALDSAAATRKGLDAGSGEIPRRPLGRTGVQVSAIGVGGHHLGDLSTVDDAVRLVHEAVDAGITFFDNCWEYYNGKTENWLGRALQQVLPELARRGIAALGMKSLGGDAQPILHGAVTAEEALRYAMSLPVATTISGIDSLAVLRQNLAVARGFTPMPPADMQALRDRCAAFAADGHLELYKSTERYDG